MRDELLQIQYALICEDTRAEANGKFAILGTYGPSPYVQVEVPGPGKLERLSVIFFGAPPAQDRSVVVEASLAPKNGPPLVKAPATLALLKGKALQLIFTMGNLQVSSAGRYAFALSINGATVATADFEIVFTNQTA